MIGVGVREGREGGGWRGIMSPVELTCVNQRYFLPSTVDLLELCGQTHLVTSSALLVADVDGYSGTAENCQVKVVSRHENLFNHLRLQLLDVDSDCRYLRMYIRDVKTSWHSGNCRPLSSHRQNNCDHCVKKPTRALM